MKLTPQAIPAIAREVIETLLKGGEIEVEPSRIADAEKDLAAIMLEHVSTEERVNHAAQEALERRSLDRSKFAQVQREMADVRGFKLGDDGIAAVCGQMSGFLLLSRNVEEVFAADDVLRRKILAVMKKHLDAGAQGTP